MSRVLQGYWHEHMLRCVSAHTDAPDRFIEWASFSVLGAVMKRKFCFKNGTYTIYPNQFVILIGPPGVGKGTAVDCTWNSLIRSIPNQTLANVINDRVTTPKIIQRVADGWAQPPTIVGQQLVIGKKEHCCTIISTELAMLTGNNDQILEFLCEGWDRSEYEYDTKNAGTSIIRDMGLSLIGCTVPDFIRGIEKSKSMSIKGGFTSRCLFVYEDSPSRFSIEYPPLESDPQSVALLAKLRGDLEHIAKLPGGTYSYSPEARSAFHAYVKNVRSTMGDEMEAVLNFKARIYTHIIKLAMVLAASRHDQLLIEEADMLTAISYVHRVLYGLEHVFRGSGDSDLALAMGHVQSFIDRKGAASKKDILKNLYRHMDADTLDRVIYVLVETEQLIETTKGATRLFRRPQDPNGLNPNGKVKP